MSVSTDKEKQDLECKDEAIESECAYNKPVGREK